MFEKGLREKVAQENTSVRCELGKLQQQLKVRAGAQRPLALGCGVSGNPSLARLLPMVRGESSACGRPGRPVPVASRSPARLNQQTVGGR